jgi:hypothetical protein
MTTKKAKTSTKKVHLADALREVMTEMTKLLEILFAANRVRDDQYERITHKVAMLERRVERIGELLRYDEYHDGVTGEVSTIKLGLGMTRKLINGDLV